MDEPRGSLDLMVERKFGKKSNSWIRRSRSLYFLQRAVNTLRAPHLRAAHIALSAPGDEFALTGQLNAGVGPVARGIVRESSSPKKKSSAPQCSSRNSPCIRCSQNSWRVPLPFALPTGALEQVVYAAVMIWRSRSGR